MLKKSSEDVFSLLASSVELHISPTTQMHSGELPSFSIVTARCAALVEEINE